MPIKRQTNRLEELSLNHHKSELLEDALRNIHEFGVDIISVAADERSLGWTYSTGLFDTYGQPEIILTGFPPRLAASIINEIGHRYENGLPPQVDERTAGLLGNSTACILKPTERVWVNRLMLRTLWYYGNDEFPVLQCICPDLQNNFPWEKDFDTSWHDRQALLFNDAPRKKAEIQLWNASSSERPLQ